MVAIYMARRLIDGAYGLIIAFTICTLLLSRAVAAVCVLAPDFAIYVV